MYTFIFLTKYIPINNVYNILYIVMFYNLYLFEFKRIFKNILFIY